MTLREALAIAKERQRYDWSFWSSQMALLANCHRDPKQAAFTPDSFDPTAKRKKAARVCYPITILKKIFIDGKQPMLGAVKPVPARFADSGFQPPTKRAGPMVDDILSLKRSLSIDKKI